MRNMICFTRHLAVVALAGLTSYVALASHLMAQGTSQWRQTSGPRGGEITTLLANGANLFAGTIRSGLFRSTNNGDSWTAVNTGLPNAPVSALAVSGSNLFASTGVGVYRSSNQGESWTGVNAGLLRLLPVNALAVSGTNIFAGTFIGGVYRSSNQGESWTAVNVGLPTITLDGETVYISVNALAVSGTNLFAGTFIGGIYRSTNNGESWSAVNTGLPSFIIQGERRYPPAIAIVVSGANLFAGIAGGVYRSTNNSQSWTAVNAGLTDLSVSALAVSGQSLFAGTNGGGVFLSTNQGESWIAINAGLPALPVNALAVSRTNLFAGTLGDGVYRSTNNGQSWAAINMGLPSLPINALAVSGANLFAGTDRGIIFRSANSGDSWALVNVGLIGGSINAFAVSGMNHFACANGGVFRSTNQGESWTAASTGLPGFTPPGQTQTLYNPAYALAVSGANLFAGIGGSPLVASGGVYRSNNNGESWTAANAGLPSNTSILSLAVSDANLYAGTDSAGVFRSTNQGESWTAANAGLTNLRVRALAVSGANLFAGTDRGVFRSSNQGGSWTAVNAGLTNLFVNVLAVSGPNLFAGTSGGGVFRSTNQGESWTEVNAGLTDRTVNALAVGGPHLFAGTGSSGVFISDPAANTVASVSAASFSGTELATESIVAAFGGALATAPERAVTIPLPTTLAGTTVKVRDSAGMQRDAPLFFVSPGQVNYQIPKGTMNGTATVTIISGNGDVSIGTAQIVSVAPGLFSANANGQGVAAAVVFRRRANGSESFEEVARFDQALNRLVAVPIDLGPGSDQVFLILFGVGLRYRSTLSAVSVKIGGADAQVTYADPAPGFVGLDQVNALIPRSLIGRGEVDVALAADGQGANTVRINIK